MNAAEITLAAWCSALDGLLERAFGEMSGVMGGAEADAANDVASAATCDTTNGIMRAKHRRTLQSMCARPTTTGIRWADIVAMLEAAGVEVSERAGSRVLLKKGAERMICIARTRHRRRVEVRSAPSSHSSKLRE